MFFDDYFRSGTDYGLVLGLTLGVFILFAMVGGKFSGKVLVGLLWGVFLTIAVLWVLMGAALPTEPSDIGCIEPICQGPGQLAIITFEIGIAPPLLLEYLRRAQKSFARSPGFSAEMWAGLGLIAAGLISLAGYYWTYLASVTLSILTAVGVLLMFTRDFPAQEKMETETHGTSLYVGQFLRDLVALVIVGVFGFSTMVRDAFSFDQLIPFGIGYLLFAIVISYLKPLSGEPRATERLEGIVVGVFTLLTGFILYMLYTYETVVIPISIPQWLVGFAAAYVCHRLDLLLSGTRMQIVERKRYFQKVPIHFIRKLTFLLFLVGLFFLMALNIDPEGTDAPLILVAGLVIGVADFLSWIHFQYQKEESG